jgi:2'-deoxynucleoside 5'-phosphate N-hydrolase
MKAFLSIPVQGHRQVQDTYRIIASTLALQGCNVMNSSVLYPPKAEMLGDYQPKQIHDELMDLLYSSSLFVADISGPSLGVGYEIRVALERQVPCIFLCKRDEVDRASIMIKGAIDGRYEMIVYDAVEDIEAVLPGMIRSVLEGQNEQLEKVRS